MQDEKVGGGSVGQGGVLFVARGREGLCFVWPVFWVFLVFYRRGKDGRLIYYHYWC